MGRVSRLLSPRYLMDSSMSFSDRSASSNLLRASWAAGGGAGGQRRPHPHPGGWGTGFHGCGCVLLYADFALAKGFAQTDLRASPATEQPQLAAQACGSGGTGARTPGARQERHKQTAALGEAEGPLGVGEGGTGLLQAPFLDSPRYWGVCWPSQSRG